jgi:hypothetical protein
MLLIDFIKNKPKMKMKKRILAQISFVILSSQAIAQLKVVTGGAVGIGTTTPTSSYKLDVNGDVIFTSYGKLKFTAADKYVGPTGASSDLGLISTTTAAWLRIGSTGGLALWGQTGGASGSTPDAFLTTSGNFGIGTTGASEKLQVQGNGLFATSGGTVVSAALIKGNYTYSSATTPDYTWYGDATTGIFHPSSGSIIGFTIGGAEKMRIHSTGNVGIGTTTTAPAEKLEVVGNAIFPSSTTYTFAPLIHASTNISSTLPDFTWAGDATTGITHPGAWQMAFTTNDGTGSGAERMRISYDGNIGIGDNTPAALFTVGSGDLFQVASTGHTRTIDGTAGAPAFSFATSGSTDNGMYKSATDEVSFSTAGTQRVVITALGTVGIANSAPGSTYKLNVSGSAFATGTWVASDNRYKKNIKAIESPLAKIMKMNGKTYEFKLEEFKAMNFNEGVNYGFIAQELKEILPEAVKQDENGFYSVNYDEVIPLLVEGIKAQQQTIETLKDKVEEMQAGINNMKSDIGDCCKANQSVSQLNSISGNVKNSLDQNIPNPFTEKTQINYTITTAFQNASISIFDMQGTLLKTFDHLSVTDGKGSLIISGNELKAGMYMYSLIIDGKEIDTKRMILTK